MEDMYIKPGNQERGWNDPPQFSYGLQKTHGPQRNLLNRRAAAGPGAPPITPPSLNPLAPPPMGAATPPRPPAASPGCVATPPPTHGPMRTQKESSQSESEPDVEVVMSVLNSALATCRRSVKEQVCNDVSKRLHLLEENWRTGKLSSPVRRRMDGLAKELHSGRWDSADDVHRSLMVDHVTEVSQWMVGVKRLIAETRRLSPEQLEGFLKTSDQDPADPDQDPVDPDQDPADPDQDPDQDPADSES